MVRSVVEEFTSMKHIFFNYVKIKNTASDFLRKSCAGLEHLMKLFFFKIQCHKIFTS